MKKISFKVFSVCIILAVISGSCELLSSKNDCDATKMESPQEPVVYIKALPKLDLLLGGQAMINADRIIFSGSIRKIYCSGKESGNFTYNPTFYVDAQMSYNDFWFPQPYQYKFDNTKDKLVVVCRAKVYFDNGKIYESSEWFDEFYYEDILLDINKLKYHIDLLFGLNIEWFEVTSK
jgi:hypothetical protein